MNTNLQLLTEVEAEPIKHVQLAYIGSGFNTHIVNNISAYFDVEHYSSLSDFDDAFHSMQFLDLPEALLIEIDAEGKCFTFIEKIRSEPSLQGFIIILIADNDRFEWKARARALKVHDFYVYPFKAVNLKDRIRFLIKLRIVKPLVIDAHSNYRPQNVSYQMPVGKRVFDIIFSILALFFLSPLFIIIAIAIRLESDGAVIYRSKRVGTGYKVFDFYKFRSMHIDADKQLEKLAQYNQYATGEPTNKSTYIKIANDPRVTKVGRFLRNTSLDELPQIYNILIGDMSFVGNRPLPLYEAEQLTSNQWSMRFLGPAGLTGLWQGSKRGKKDMSELERKELDNQYATQYSFWLDLKIILSTIPALIQQEKV